ncbi:MAG: hypothetical protein WC608_04495 [Parcubacteria group bacterium]
MEERFAMLLRWWELFRLSERAAVFSMEYNYGNTPGSKMLREDIVDALVFWKFIIEKAMTALTTNERPEFLQSFFEDKNPFIKVVAIVECFPTKVWRKILWGYNIDFSSCESFLRRLTANQLSSIQENYLDLFSRNEVPRVFTKFDKRFRGITAEKLLAEAKYDDDEKRYASKGAMSYNLLNLDFGFNAFPRGVANDTKKIEISPLQFLSVKNHADDFVVNMEDGKYWGLYRSVRSNYVWKPKKLVQLSTHICPGFWYTLLMQFLFWVVSPVLAIAMASVIASGHSHSIPNALFIGMAIPGMFTPVWLALATAKYSFNKILTENVKKKWNDFGERHEEALTLIGVIAGGLVVSAAAIAAVIGTYLVAKPLGIFWASVTVVLVFTGLFLILNKKNNRFYFWAHPEVAMILKIALPTFAGGLLIRITYPYYQVIAKIALWVWGILESFASMVISIISMLGMVSLVFIFPFVFFALMAFLSKNLTEEQMEKFCIALEKAMPFGVGFTFVASLAVFVANVNEAVPSPIIIIGMLMFLATGILLAIFSSQAFNKYDPRFISNADVLNEACGDEFRRKRIKAKWVLKNKWLQSLSKEERELKIIKLVAAFGEIFGILEREIAYLEFIPIMTASALDDIAANVYDIRPFNKGRMKIVRLMIASHSLSEAIFLYQQKQQRRERGWKRTKKIFMIIFFPAVLLYWALKKLLEYSKTLFKLWKLFNKLCPYVTQTRTLKIGS